MYQSKGYYFAYFTEPTALQSAIELRQAADQNQHVWRAVKELSGKKDIKCCPKDYESRWHKDREYTGTAVRA